MSDSRVPLVEPSAATVARLTELGGRTINLYRVLANAPPLLDAWIEFAWALRSRCVTPRRVRELMILRGAQLFGSDYEWQQHVTMALASGIDEQEISQLSDWRSCESFTAAERAALAYAECVSNGDVPAAVAAELARHFTDSEVVELALTAAFYAAVPRFLDALSVPLEAG